MTLCVLPNDVSYVHEKIRCNKNTDCYDFSGGLDVCTIERGNAAMLICSLSWFTRTLGICSVSLPSSGVTTNMLGVEAEPSSTS